MKRKDLESIFYLKKELRMWEDRLSELQADIALSPKAFDGMPFAKTNATSSPTEQKAILLAEADKVIKGKVAEIKIAIADVESYIMTIDDTVLRQILEYRCVCCMSWRSIAAKLGTMYSEDNVRQMYHRFVSKI